MAFLNDTEALCLETEALRLSIETTQSELWPELYELLALFSDLDLMIQHLAKLNGSS